ncbi:MAG: C25 family cysteine peptidase, partial [archaeon]
MKSKRARKIQRPHEFEIILLVILCSTMLFFFAGPENLTGGAKQVVQKIILEQDFTAELDINETNITEDEPIIMPIKPPKDKIKEIKKPEPILIEEPLLDNGTNETPEITFNLSLRPGLNVTPDSDENLTIITFSGDDITLDAVDGFDMIYLAGLPIVEEEGELMLPYKTIYLSIPYDKKLKSIEVENYAQEELPGSYHIPLFPGYIKDDLIRTKDFLSPDPEDYDPISFYPQNIVEFSHQGSIRGNKFIVIRVNAVRHNPLTGKTVFHPYISFKTTLEDSKEEVIVSKTMKKSKLDTILVNLLNNKNEFSKNRPKYQPKITRVENVFADLITGDVILGGDLAPRSIPPFQNTTIEYIIITNNYDLDGTYIGEMQAEFQRLADWKTQKGIPTLVVNLTWIKENFPQGFDTQEHVRNFIREAFIEWGTQYILIGGDTRIILDRKVTDNYNTPTDLYYADIDTDWNPNKNQKIENTEVNDAYPDLLVGRAPVNNRKQAEIFINKTLFYEKSAPSDYVNNILFMAGPFYGTVGEGCWDGETFPMHKESLNATYIPDRIRPYRLYTPQTYYDYDESGYKMHFSDINGNGISESVIATFFYEDYQTSIKIFTENGQSLNPAWPIQISGLVEDIFSEDMDGDGDKELFMIKSHRSGMSISAWYHTGTLIPGWENISINSTKVLNFTDIDGSGTKEVIYIDKKCSLNIINNAGKDLPGMPITLDPLSDIGDVVCGYLKPIFSPDPDLDGTQDIFIGLKSSSPNIGAQRILGFEEYGNPLPGWPLDLTSINSKYNNPNLYFEDIDMDSEVEVIVETLDTITGRSDLYVVEYDTTVKPGWPKLNVTDRCYMKMTDLVDDAKKEIVLSINIMPFLMNPGAEIGDTMFAWHEDGSLVDYWPLQDFFAVLPMYIEDFDNDGKKDIFLMELEIGEIEADGSVDAYRYIERLSFWMINYNGTMKQGNWPITDFSIYSYPAIIEDLNNDGSIEIILGGKFIAEPISNSIYIFNPDASVFNLIEDKQFNILELIDVDLDPDLELVFREGVGVEEKSIFFMDPDGTVLAGWPVDDIWQESSLYGKVFNVNNFESKPGLEIIYDGNNYSLIECKDLSGADCDGWPIDLQAELGKLQYVADDVLRRSTGVNALNQNYHIINHEDHSFTHGLGAGYKCYKDTISDSDMDSLTNAPYYSILWSDGCDPAAFDYFSVSEHYLLNPNGGGVAFIGDTRAGYISQRVQDNEFFNALYILSMHSLGEAFVNSQVTATTVYNRYALNLLGDPSLDIWTDTIHDLEVSHQASVALGLQTIDVSVMDLMTGLPVADATVCITKDDEVFATAKTDINGDASLEISPRTTGSTNLTVSLHNYHPFQDNIIITPSSSEHLIVKKVKVVDYGPRSNGNANNLVDAGETIELNITLENNGNFMALGTNLFIETDHPCVFIASGQETALYGDILRGENVTHSFLITFQPDCSDFTRVGFNLSLTTDNPGYFSTEHISLEVHAPVLRHVLSRVDDSSGDNDQIPEPGETITLPLVIRNFGNGIAKDVEVMITSEGSTITIEQGNSVVTELLPGEEALISNLRFSIDNLHVGEVSLKLNITDSESRTNVSILTLSKPEDISGIGFHSATLQSIKIRWDAPNDVSNLKGYNVYRSQEENGLFERINKKAITGASIFEDSDLEMGGIYFYKVTGMDSSSTEGEFSEGIGINSGFATQEGWPQIVGSGIEKGPKAFDINDDGKLELFVGADKVYGFNYTGALLEGFPLE